MSEDKQPRQAPIPSKDWHCNELYLSSVLRRFIYKDIL